MDVKNEEPISLREAEKKDRNMIRNFIEHVDSEFYPPLSKRPGGIEERVERGLAKPEANFIMAEEVRGLRKNRLRKENRLKECPPGENPGSGRKGPDRLAGLLSFEKAWEGEKNAYISFMAVNPFFRNQRIGSRLISFLEARMRSEGMKQLYVCTWSTNRPALTLYEKQGFLTARVVKEARGPGVDSVYLVKNII